ncbi:MAG: hypothetical protein IJ661_04030 [Lachnospiraceae bacterium]|nr:hypothetical protein [Lachnospiraceae bacterium]
MRDEISYSDFDVIQSFEKLSEWGGVALYGAGIKGKYIFNLLQEAGVNVCVFFDKCAEKNEAYISDKKIVSPNKISDIVKGGIIGSIIACIERPEEAYDELQKMYDMENFGQLHFITYWGINFSLYLNRDNLFKGKLKVLSDFDKEYAYNTVRYARQALDYLSGIICGEGNVWILQPGKVGSTSLNQMLDTVGLPSASFHSLQYPKHILRECLEDVWKNFVSKSKQEHLKIISVVRSPLDRDYSAFWTAFGFPQQRGWYIPFSSGDFQLMYYQFTESIIEGNDKLIEMCGLCHPFTWREEFEWFDDEIKSNLGIDIYDYPFDRENGYQIIKHGNIEMFLMKLEKMPDVLTELSDFLGLSEVIELRRDFSADKKWYSMAYKEFRKEVKISREYVEHYFNGNKKMDYFYTKDEQMRFLEKWKENIR